MRGGPRGGEPPDLGGVSFTGRVIPGDLIRQLVDVGGEQLAQDGEEPAGVPDPVLDLGEPASPVLAGQLTVGVHDVLRGRISAASR